MVWLKNGHRKWNKIDSIDRLTDRRADTISRNWRKTWSGVQKKRDMVSRRLRFRQIDGVVGGGGRAGKAICDLRM